MRQVRRLFCGYCGFLFACGGLVASAVHARAATLYESATPGNTPSAVVGNPGTLQQQVGVRFTTHTSVTATAFGGSFEDLGSGNHQIWGALIALTSASDFPDSAIPLNTPDVLAVALLTLPAPTSHADVSVSIPPVSLTAGSSYALIFGSGQFGATGIGLVYGGTSIGTPIDIYHESQQGPGYFVDNPFPRRYFVTGIVPEPTSLAAVTAIALATRRRR